MSTMKAIGAYVRVMREQQGWKQAQLAHRAGTHESQIGRVERGEQAPKGPLFMKIIKAVNGNLEDVFQLILQTDADVSHGEKLAEQRWSGALNQQAVASEQRLVDLIPADMIDEVLSVVEGLAPDRDRLVSLVGYGQRLAEERRAAQASGPTDPHTPAPEPLS